MLNYELYKVFTNYYVIQKMTPVHNADVHKMQIILNSVFSAADAVDCLLCQIEEGGKLCDRHKVEDVG